jgi:hypothetical protein
MGALQNPLAARPDTCFFRLMDKASPVLRRCMCSYTQHVNGA